VIGLGYTQFGPPPTPPTPTTSGGAASGGSNVLGGAAMGLMAAGAVIKAFGAYQAAKSHNKSMEYQAAILEQNKRRMLQYAEDVRKAGAEKGRRQRIFSEEVVGVQRAAAASSGVRVDSGSTLDITESTASLGEADALDIEYNALRQSMSVESKAISMGVQAGLLRSTKRDPGLAAVSSGLGSLGPLAAFGAML